MPDMTTAVVSALARHAAASPRRIALTDGRHELDFAAVERSVSACAAALRCNAAPRIALALENSPAWAIADLAALAAGVPCVPLPEFFSTTQTLHVLADAGAGQLITDRPGSYAELLRGAGIAFERVDALVVAGTLLSRFRLRLGRAAALPPGTAKLTYTSGTTGAPKGVCLGADALARVAQSLAAACRLGRGDRHLALLPLSTLLENVGGVYAPLLAGATCVLPPLAAVGMTGAGSLDPDTLLGALDASGATTAIVTPQMLHAAVAALEAGRRAPTALRFLAVGGAPLHASLLGRAAAVGLPAYQGYGLSECASVVTLNTPQHDRPGSVGRVLPHARLRIAPDGEILVAGATALGYCNAPGAAHESWPTGDIGRLDREGYLYLIGRKKNIFITSFGRNVSPEWVESELASSGAIAQAWVWGEARPWNAAVLTPAPGCTPADVEAAVAAANRCLPDYARVTAWIASDRPFSAAAGELTANGRPRRDALLARYRARIDRLYTEHNQHVL